MDDPVLHKLRERVKELTALHRTARLLQHHERPTGELIAAIAEQLPGAWQYPEVTAARIRFRDDEVCTPGFRETFWRQHADFAARSGERGSITVVYLEPRPAADEGPFLSEERDLIDSLAELLRAHLEHVLADEALLHARDALEEQVAARTADLRRLASRLTLTEARERRAIAADLHDHIGQALALIKLRLRELQSEAIFAGQDETIAEVLLLLEQTIRYTRDLTGTISPPVLYELGLEPGLDWLAEQFSTRRGLRVALRTQGRARPLPDELAVMVFQSAQELLTNCLKHAGVEEAELRLEWAPERLRLSVADRGRGCDPARAAGQNHDGFGLFSLRERCRDLGGELAIDSRPGAGCRVTLSVPLPPPTAPEEAP